MLVNIKKKELEIMFKSYKDSLLNNEFMLKSQQRFKSDHHKVYTEEAVMMIKYLKN